jgi:superfamily II DNA/RNA helicase
MHVKSGVSGGMPYWEQLRPFSTPVDIIVATPAPDRSPGARQINLSRVEILVLMRLTHAGYGIQ